MRHWGKRAFAQRVSAAALLTFSTSYAASAAQTSASETPATAVTLSAGQVTVQSNKSAQLNMYLPNSGALAGAKSNRVLGAAFTMNKAGTVITVSSGYHARNNKAIRGYIQTHALDAPGARGSLNAHWANEADLYRDIRRERQDDLPSLELESLHELGIRKTLGNGLTMGVQAKSRNDQQSVTANLGYRRGAFNYSGVMTQNMLVGQGLSGKQHLSLTLGKTKLNGGMVMRTLRDGSLETFPYAQAQAMLKGIEFTAHYKRDPKLQVAGQFTESTRLMAAKTFVGGKLKFNSDTSIRSAAGTRGLLSTQLGFTYSASEKDDIFKWSLTASGTALSGGDHRAALGLIEASDTWDFRSHIGALSANMTYQLSRKTQLGFKGNVKHLSGTLGTYNRATLSTSIKHGLWDVEAMAGLNGASENADALAAARGGLHHRFAQKAFGQFTQQRAIFSLKVKYSY